MSDRNTSSFEIYSLYISSEGLHLPEQLAKRIDDGVHFKIARRDLVQHRGEQKVVVARHQCDVYVTAAAQRSFQFDRGRYAAEAATQYEDTAGAICVSFEARRTPASIVMIFGLIHLICRLWESLHLADCSIA